MNTNEISQGINRLKNRIDEALTRSASATLNSHRGLSATLDAAPQQAETYKNASYTTTESDLYRSVQNYQVKSVHGFEPSYLPVHNHYQSFVPTQSYIQPLIIPYGHQYPVQEVRSATYGYEPYVLGAPTHFYQPLEYVVDEHEETLSQRNQSSGKKKSTRSRKQELQNDEDSFSKDPKKTQPQTQQNQPNNVPQQNQAAQQNQAPQQNQAIQQNQAPQQNQTAQQTQPPQQNQAAQQTQQQNQPPKQNQSQQSQPPQQNQDQSQQKPAIDKSNLIQLPKKPYLIDTYNFGQEKRRGGSQRI